MPFVILTYLNLSNEYGGLFCPVRPIAISKDHIRVIEPSWNYSVECAHVFVDLSPEPIVVRETMQEIIAKCG